VLEIRKIKDYAGNIFSILGLALLLGLIFYPMSLVGPYAYKVFSFFIAFLPFYLVAEAYYFLKDTPKRKAGLNQKKDNKNTIWKYGEWALYAVLIVVFLLARDGSILKRGCPESVDGNPDSNITVYYFYNTFCPSCWKQEIEIQEAMKTLSRQITLNRYDYRYCKDEFSSLGLKSVPGFLLQYGNETELLGFISGKELKDTVCSKLDCSEN